MKNLLLFSLYSLIGLSNQLHAEEHKTTNTADTAAESEQQAVFPRVIPDPYSDRQRDIAGFLEGSVTEVIALQALEQEFSIYFLGADEKEPIGSILFFPDQRNHSDWPINLNPLRVGLTRYKWQTAVLTLPEIITPAIPKRSVYTAEDVTGADQQQENSDAATDTDTDIATKTDDDAALEATEKQNEAADTTNKEDDPVEKLKSMAEITLARATATVELLKQTTEPIIIIGIGQGATWAAAFAQTITDEALQNSRLLLINPQQATDPSVAKLTALIKNVKVNTFDIYTPINASPTNPNDPAHRRKRAANLSEIESYQQIKAPASAWTAGGNQWLFRKIRGLIKNDLEKSLDEQQEMAEEAVVEEKVNQMPGGNNN